MNPHLIPATWLIVLILSLPQFSESMYASTLPSIASVLHIQNTLVEYTLTIYLLGFAIGALIWGRLSDNIGRKPCILSGILTFIFGCIGCYFAQSINSLMFYRFIQGLGASAGGVIGQAICRDSFHGRELGKIYSSMGIILAVIPAVGSTAGGVMTQSFGWNSIFLILIFFSLLLNFIVLKYLPETHLGRASVSIIKVGRELIKDKRVIVFGIIVGLANGITYSYFAEGSFYLIIFLGLTPSQYGASFIAIAASAMCGSLLSKSLHKNHTSKMIMSYGILIVWITSALFSLFILWHINIQPLPNGWLIGITIISQMFIVFSVRMITNTALALALIDYKWCQGTASSLFSFSYFCLMSLTTFFMGILHNDTMLPMPLYFWALSSILLFLQRYIVDEKEI